MYGGEKSGDMGRTPHHTNLGWVIVYKEVGFTDPTHKLSDNGVIINV